MRPTDVTVYYLEMTSPQQLRPKRATEPELSVIEAKLPVPAFSRFLYTAVGGDWYWIDRLSWTHADWLAWLEQPGLSTRVGYHNGSPVGYYELVTKPDRRVDIAYFGLLPQFIGRGFGGRLLTHAVEIAWQRQPSRVTLNTCTLDHPAALANYQARGFRIYREAREVRKLPDRAPGPWPEV